MSEHAELLEIAELYAIGGLADEERARLEQHLADGCAECQAVLRANLDVASELLLATAPAPPASTVREGLLARVRGEADRFLVLAPPRGRKLRRPVQQWRARWLAAAAIVLVLGSTGASALLGARLARERERSAELEDLLAYEESISWALVREAERERSQRVALETRLRGLSRIVAAIEAPLARSLALAGQGEFRRAQAKAYLEPASGRLILYAYDLPPVPDGRTYQLWVIVGEQPQSAGLFRSDSSGEAKYDSARLQDLDGPVTVAVTLEPAGGAPRPTGPLVLAGS
ncbi:MAG: anti-sigma factor [Deltaproteobacteria bacterium]|nr:anti-sigma factor [Deltaproteobacteria bacterium]